MRYHEIIPAPILLELFDSSAIQWTDATHATFKVGGVPYIAQFKQDAGGSDYYEFSFYAPKGEKEGEFGNTGKQGAASAKVFGSAIQCMVQFIRKHEPRWMEFAGFHDTGRDQLYDKMAARLAPKFSEMGYKLSTRTKNGISGPHTEFVLERTYQRKMPLGPYADPHQYAHNLLSPEEKAKRKARMKADFDAIFAELDELGLG